MTGRRAALAAAVFAISGAARAANCSVSATPVAFGVYLPFSGTPTNSTGTVTVNCTGRVTIVVALSTGGSGSYASRLMSNGANTLTYQLYTNAAHSLVWGNGTAGTSTVSANVSGHSTTNFTAYGQIPALQGVAPLTYTDTITVTVTY